jgi:hypothetical protein
MRENGRINIRIGLRRTSREARDNEKDNWITARKKCLGLSGNTEQLNSKGTTLWILKKSDAWKLGTQATHNFYTAVVVWFFCAMYDISVVKSTMAKYA